MPTSILATALALAVLIVSGCSSKNEKKESASVITEEYGQREVTPSTQHNPNPLKQAQEEEIAE